MDKIESLFYDYKNMEKEMKLLRSQLDQFVGISENEMLDTMVYLMNQGCRPVRILIAVRSLLYPTRKKQRKPIGSFINICQSATVV